MHMHMRHMRSHVHTKVADVAASDASCKVGDVGDSEGLIKNQLNGCKFGLSCGRA